MMIHSPQTPRPTGRYTGLVLSAIFLLAFWVTAVTLFAAELKSGGPDLSTSTKAVDHSNASAGDTLHYTIVLNNTGSNFASVVFTDSLPVDVTYVPGTLVLTPSGGTATTANNTITWTGVVDQAATKTIAFDVTISNTVTAGDMVTNTAQIDDGVVTLERTAVTTIVAPPPVELSTSTKSVDLAQALAGDSLHYTIAITNTGSTFDIVTVTDTLPVDLSYETGSIVISPAGGNSQINGNTIIWTGVVDNGAVKTISFDATISNTVSAGDILTNTAAIAAVGTTALYRSASTEIISLTPADLTGSSKVATPTDVSAGYEVTYTLTVSNSGEQIASGAVLTDVLPTGLSYVANSLSVESGSGSFTGNTLHWSGDVAGLSDVTLSFRALLDAALVTGDVITNSAHIAANNTVITRTAVITVAPSPADLSGSSKTATPLDVPAGYVVTYTLTLSNSGEQAASGAVLTDALPSGVSYVANSLVVESGSGSFTGNTLHWSGNVAGLSDVVISFRALLADTFDTGDSVSNAAQIGLDNTVITRTAVITIAPPPVYYGYLPLAIRAVPKVTAQITRTSLNDWSVAWNIAAPNVNSYELQESTSSDFANPTNFTLASNITIKTITENLPNTYYFRVRAKIGTQVAPWSNVVSVFVPTAPVLQTTTPDANYNWSVSWSDLGTAVNGYELQEASDAAFTVAVTNYSFGTGITSQSIHHDPSNIFYYRVRATVNGFAGPWSNVASVVNLTPLTLQTTAPDANYNWTVSWNNLGATIAYELQEATDAAFTTGFSSFNISAGTVSQGFHHTPTAVYYYRVRAVVNGVNGGWSNTLPVAVIAQTALQVSRPTSTNNWVASWTSLGASITEYELQESQTSDFATVTTYNVPGATVSQALQHAPTFKSEYYYRVRAKFDTYSGPWSNVVGVIAGYRDDFSNNTSGWAIRRTTYLEKTTSWYENGSLIMKVESASDWGITSPLIKAPAVPYVIEYKAVTASLGPSTSHGAVFGGDWTGLACPDYSSTTGIYQHTRCFNHFYNTNTIYWSNSLIMAFERIDKLTWCPTCGGSPMKRTGDVTANITLTNVTPGSWNTYRIEVRSDNIKIYVNNTLVKTYTHMDWVNEPYFGIFASTNDYSNSTWKVDYFQVLPLDQ